MTPNPADGKPRKKEELLSYRRKVLLQNRPRLLETECPECHVKSLEFTGTLLDLDAAFIRCTNCNYEGWCMLKNTGLTSELCRYLEGNLCTLSKRECNMSFNEVDLRTCKLFKEAVSESHRRVYTVNKELKEEGL